MKDTFVSTVQQRGAAILKARGFSSAASAANAIITGVSHLVTDTVTSESYSMCRASKGEYGVDKGLIFSVPCRTEQGTIKVVENLAFNTFSQDKFDQTLTELRQERDMVKELGLLD